MLFSSWRPHFNFIIDFSEEQAGKIYFGAWVEIENDAGEQKTLRIVGVDEIYDHHPQHISIDSPMARALLSKQVDDEIEVLTPTGKKHWYVNSIRYDRPESSESKARAIGESMEMCCG